MHNICIIGPDGAGKTSHITKLIAKFGQQDQEYKYCWLGSRYLLSIPLLLYARAMGYTSVEVPPNGEKVSYHHFEESKFLCFFYPLSLWLDTVIHLTLKYYIPRYILGQNIICDRFVFDTLIDLGLSINHKEIISTKIGKLFLRLVPSKLVVILLIADPEQLRKRRSDVYYDKKIAEKVVAYRRLATQLDIPIIDANSRSETVQKEIIRIMRKYVDTIT
ncbi:hypothetical protein [Methanoculleus sp.]|uniref:hypothetical protein n=1 Tax=Methanoculleus sp. TaxID=90427 RepID=UPI0025E65C66|nr:hypothetical protein [Methanoculleus sp.]